MKHATNTQCGTGLADAPRVTTASGHVRNGYATRCALCWKERVSVYSFPGVTQDTGEPVCFDCWARGRRSAGDMVEELVAAIPARGQSQAGASAPLQAESVGRSEEWCGRCGHPFEAVPAAQFPLSAKEFARERGMDLDAVVEAMHSLAKRDHGYLVCKDEAMGDFLLEMRG